MGNPKQPIALVVAKGKTHLSKAEIKEREEAELKVDLTNVTPPSYLPSELVEEFNEIAGKLLHIGIITELDEDCLARYLLSKQTYLEYTSLLNKAIKDKKILDMEKVATLQDKAFKQCRASANDLGLTIISRCKIVIPKVEEPKENKFIKKFGGVS